MNIRTIVEMPIGVAVALRVAGAVPHAVERDVAPLRDPADDALRAGEQPSP